MELGLAIQRAKEFAAGKSERIWIDDRTWKILELRFEENKSIPEIATIFSLHPSTITDIIRTVTPTKTVGRIERIRRCEDCNYRIYRPTNLCFMCRRTRVYLENQISRTECFRCKSEQKLRIYTETIDRFGFDIVKSICRACTSADRRTRYTTNPQLRESVRRSLQRSIAKFPHKQKARHDLNQAVRLGNKHRPTTCSTCHIPGRIEGHHYDYSKPLDVIWLCSGCHADLHKIGLGDNSELQNKI